MLGEKKKQMSYTGISVLPSPRKIMKKEGSGKFLFVFFFRDGMHLLAGHLRFFAGQVLLGLK
jgi:hypothetical protein